jgi:long-chain acyl-CoA synthetase
LYATTSLGAQYVPMYEAQLEKDWKYIIEDSGAKMIIAATEKVYDKVKSYVGTVGVVEGVICLDSKPEFMHSYQR